MTRVKMNAKHEYEFIANFKVLQNVFKAKKIDKVRQTYDLNHFIANITIFSLLLNFWSFVHPAYPGGETREMQDAVRDCLIIKPRFLARSHIDRRY